MQRDLPSEAVHEGHLQRVDEQQADLQEDQQDANPMVVVEADGGHPRAFLDGQIPQVEGDGHREDERQVVASMDDDRPQVLPVDQAEEKDGGRRLDVPAAHQAATAVHVGHQ